MRPFPSPDNRIMGGPGVIKNIMIRALFIYSFSSGCQYFFMLAVIFCLLKNYHPMQKMMSVVIDVYRFGQEIFTIGIFWKCLYKSQKTIPVKAAKNAFLQHGKNYMQPAQIKLHTHDNFLQHAKIQPPHFAG